MEVSAKAQENVGRYAVLTAQNTAAAVERNTQKDGKGLIAYAVVPDRIPRKEICTDSRKLFWYQILIVRTRERH